jgi:hypothetical protein
VGGGRGVEWQKNSVELVFFVVKQSSKKLNFCTRKDDINGYLGEIDFKY